MENEQKLRDYLKRVTADLRQVRRQLRESESRHSEPIAIAGASATTLTLTCVTASVIAGLTWHT